MIPTTTDQYTVKELDTEHLDMGMCPKCHTPSYHRHNLDADGDALFYDCTCDACAFHWKETFYLKYQEWKEATP